MSARTNIVVACCATCLCAIAGLAAYFGIWQLFFGALALAVYFAKFQRFHLILTTLVFLLASTTLPGASAFTLARWVILALSTGIAVLLWIESKERPRFGIFHGFAGLAVLVILISSLYSVNPLLTLYKATAFSCLIVYAAVGAQLLGAKDENRLSRYLLVGATLLTYFSAICVFGFDYNPFFNPNNLGAALSVIAWPVLFWKTMSKSFHWRALPYFCTSVVCLAVILDSRSRASLLAAIFASFAILFTTKHTKMLAGVMLGGVIFLAAAFFYFPKVMQELVVQIAYKGDVYSQAITSREAPWRETLDNIKQSPWVGSGFGASRGLSEAWTGGLESWAYEREKGSSYSALVEELGFIGSMPFFLMLFYIADAIRRTRSHYKSYPRTFAVPAAGLLAAGLTDTIFEGWMIAPGFYLAVIFWGCAFILVDLVNNKKGVWLLRNATQMHDHDLGTTGTEYCSCCEANQLNVWNKNTSNTECYLIGAHKL